VKKIRISWPTGEVTAHIRDTVTARSLFDILPCTARACTWGEEVYFSLPVEVRLEPDARQVVEPGTVCFWVDGQSLALPFGPTPISIEGECRLVTRCNVLGQIEGNPRALLAVRDGDAIRVEPA